MPLPKDEDMDTSNIKEEEDQEIKGITKHLSFLNCSATSFLLFDKKGEI